MSDEKMFKVVYRVQDEPIKRAAFIMGRDWRHVRQLWRDVQHEQHQLDGKKIVLISIRPVKGETR